MPLPDNFDADAFDRAQGRDDDGDEARAKEAMAYAVAELAKMEAINAILRKARTDILAVGLIEEWHGGYDKDGITAILAEITEWDAAEVKDHIFTNKMEELEAGE
jgi:hypothetical protein